MAYNRQKVARQDVLIDSLTRDWDALLPVDGVRWRLLDAQGGMPQDSAARNERLHPDGTVVRWVMDVALTDGSQRMHFDAANPTEWMIGFSDWPTGFHDLAARTLEGDSVEAWLPAGRAWGLSGRLPEVPQDAAIHLWFKVIAVEATASS